MRACSLPTAFLLATLTGCCPMARFFCGPDRTPWVSIDHSTPEATVRTMLEALRRDEPEVLYRCLAEDYTQSLGIDGLTMQLAWPKIVAANPGLHVAGYAEVPEARRLSPEAAEITLAIEGRPVSVKLQRLSRWRVRYERPSLPPLEPGGEPRLRAPAEISRALDGTHETLVVQQGADEVEQSTLQVAATRISHFGVDTLTPAQVEFFGVERVWKIRDIRVLD